MRVKRLIAALMVFCLLLSNVPGFIPVAHATEAEEHSHDHETTATEETVEETVPAESETVQAEELLSEETEPVTEAPAAQEEADTLASEEYPAIEPGVETEVTITTGGEIVYFSFVPTATDFYSFTSIADADTVGYLYDADMNQLIEDDDDGEGNNFLINSTLQEGVQYYFAVRYYNSGYTGSLKVLLNTEHYYSFVVTAEATCTEDGLRTYSCDYCGDSYTEVIPAGHSYGAEVITTEPTCTEEGMAEVTCSVCGHVNSYSISALGHTYVGTTCSVCGESKMQNLQEITAGETKTVEITTGGEIAYFSFVPEVTDRYAFTSSYDGDYIDLYGYLYDSNLDRIASNDDSAGNGNFQIDYILEAGVQYYFGARFYSSGTTGTFNVSLEYSHSFSSEVTTAPTCTESGVATLTCDYCGYTTTEAIEPGHSFGEVIVDVAATCTENGQSHYECTACGYTESWSVYRLGHDFENSVCTRCGLDATAFAAYTLGEEATATISTEGEMVYFSITPEVTDYYSIYSSGDYDTLGYLYDSEMYQLRSNDDAGDGNNFKLEYTLYADETYYLGITMNNVGQTGSFTIGSALVHGYYGEVTTAPTCTTEGVVTYTCSYCGDSYTAVAEMADHSYTDGVCTVCGVDLLGDKTALQLDTRFDAQITETGGKYYFYYIPEITDYYQIYSSTNKDTYVTLYDANMEQLSSNDDGGESNNFALYYTLEAGETYIFEVRYLSSSDIGTFPVYLTVAHSYSYEEKTPATCTEDGVAILTCQYCGYSEEAVIEAGHQWGETVVSQAATCTTSGLEGWTCTVCGEEESWATPALGHSLVDGVCSNCNEDVVSQLPALTLNTPAVAEITQLGQYVYYTFTPEVTECYTYYSTGSSDVRGYVYDTDWNRLASNTYGDDDLNFRVYSVVLEAGTTYIMAAKMRDSEAVSGTFSLRVEVRHSYAYTVETEATCTEYGVARYTCEYCDDTYTEEIYPHHSYGEVEVVTEPTCTERGLEREVCTSCGYEDTWYVSALGHSCTNGVCDVCGLDVLGSAVTIYEDIETSSEITAAGEFKYFTFTPSQTEQYLIQSTGSMDTYGYLYNNNMEVLTYSNWGGNNQNFGFGYSLLAGQTYVIGVRSGDWESTGSFGIKVEVCHNYNSEVTTPNTCTTAGVMTYTCLYCGDSYTEEIAAAHTWGAGAVCTVCNEQMPIITLDAAVTANITTGGEKVYFQFTPDADEGYIFRSNSARYDPYARLYDLNMNQLAQNDDSETDGEYTLNFGLNYEMTAGTTYILAVALWDDDVTTSFPVTVGVGHAYEGVETTPSTCTEDGVMTYTCKYCDDSYTAISYARHDFANGSSCSVCGMEMTLSGQCGDNLTWEIDLNGGYLSIEGSGPMWDFDGVAPWNHLWYRIYEVELPDGLESIGDYAFANLRYLYYLYLPKSVASVGDYFVSGCSELEGVRFSGEAPTFAENAFGGAELNANYPEGEPTWTTDVLQNYGGDVQWHSYSYQVASGNVDGVGYWELYSSGFLHISGDGNAMTDWTSAEATPWYQYASRILSVEIYGFTNIGSNAFAGLTSLWNVYIGDGIEVIGENAFANCTALEDIYFVGNAPDISYNAFCNVTASASYDADKSGWIPSILQNYQGDLQWHSRSNGILDSGDYGEIYWEVSKDGYLYVSGASLMPSEASASEYPWYAYKDQITAASVYTNSIGDYAFQGYPALADVYIGENIESIGTKAFADCSELVYMIFYCNAPSIAADAFENVVAEAGYHHLDETWTEEKLQGYGGELEWYTYTRGIEWGSQDGISWNLQDNGTLHINANDKPMFSCTSAEEYPWSAYADQITKVYVNCTTISDYAFASLTKLETVYINGAFTSIGAQAFSGCSALTLVYFGDMVAPQIASDAFTGVTAAVKYNGCAEGWPAIEGNNYGGTLTWTPYNAIVASGTYGSVTWKLGESKILYLTGDNAAMTDKTAASSYPWYQYRASIAYVITSGVTNIGTNAFSGYTVLEAVEFDDAIAVIGAKSFANCTALGQVYFTGEAPDIATNAFLNDTLEIWYNQSKAGWAEMDFSAYSGTIEWTAYGTPIPVYEVTFTSGSVSLAGDIGLNFYVELSEDVVNDGDAYMEFTYGSQVQRMYLHDAVANEDGTYRFSCPLAAKQMAEEVTAQVYVSAGAVGEAKVYSVKAYCDAAIPVYSQYANYANLVELMKAMLNYGAYSQLNFGYNTDVLANADLSDTSVPTITEDMVADYAHGQSGTESGISISSVSLLLESTTTIRFYFKLDGTRAIDTYSFYVDGVKVKPVQSGDGVYYVDKTNVAAKELDEMTTVRVGGLSVWYCGMSYVRQVAVLYSSYYSEALVNVAKALYAYNQAANNFFA